MKLTELETPCYIINEREYEKNMADFRRAFETRWNGAVQFGYSVKTNNFPWLLRRALERGFQAEVVSPDEWEFAQRCGCRPEHIIYNGPQKRETVLTALRAGAMVNLDSLEETERVCDVFRNQGSSLRIGLRVNFDLESECPEETTCRGVPGRFGICLENGDLARALELLRNNKIPLYCLHMHQSSRTRSLRIFASIANKAAEIGKEFELEELPALDLGGGFFGGSFFPGKPNPDEYAETVCESLKKFFQPEVTTLVLEPGAAILATAMDYLTSVLNIREVRGNRIVTVDGSLLHINPMMNPHPTPFTMIHPGADTKKEQIIGGSTCMEMDRFWPRELHQLAEHDSRFLFHCCGAYMAVHNSNFINAAPNIYLQSVDGSFHILRKKSLDPLFAQQ